MYLINVAKDSLLDRLVLDNLAKNTSIATTNDKDLLRLRVRVHGQVCDHLLVCKLIALGALDDVVEDENISVVGRLEDENILVQRFLVVKDFLDLESHGLARPHVGDLTEPSICRGLSVFVYAN